MNRQRVALFVLFAVVVTACSSTTTATLEEIQDNEVLFKYTVRRRVGWFAKSATLDEIDYSAVGGDWQLLMRQKAQVDHSAQVKAMQGFVDFLAFVAQTAAPVVSQGIASGARVRTREIELEDQRLRMTPTPIPTPRPTPTVTPPPITAFPLPTPTG